MGNRSETGDWGRRAAQKGLLSLLLVTVTLLGCASRGVLVPEPGEAFPEQIHKAPLRNYFANRPVAVFCFESAAGAPGTGRQAALLLYQGLLQMRVFTQLAFEIDLGTVSLARQAEVAEKKGYEFVISGSVAYYFDGGKTRDSRVDQEMRIVNTATKEPVWYAGATATGKAVHDADMLLYVSKGKAGPPPEALMAVNAKKFCNLILWESPRYRSLREDMQMVDTGYNFLMVKQYDAAKFYFEEALKIWPENPYAHLNLGVVYEAQGKQEDAVRAYKQVVALKPKDTVQESTDPAKIGVSLESLARDNLKRLGYDSD